MARDFSSQIAKARTTIEKNGRLVTFHKITATDTAANHFGPAVVSLKDRAEKSTIRPAVFIPISGLASLGMTRQMSELYKTFEKTCLVGALDNEDLADYTHMEDTDGTLLVMARCDALQPGEQIILHYCGLNGA